MPEEKEFHEVWEQARLDAVKRAGAITKSSRLGWEMFRAAVDTLVALAPQADDHDDRLTALEKGLSDTQYALRKARGGWPPTGTEEQLNWLNE